MYKELKLKANHNPAGELPQNKIVVIKCTKSWSWKQITTSNSSGICSSLLLSNVQRAEVESKSQLRYLCPKYYHSCYQMYKELKLKANHNLSTSVPADVIVVIKCTKSWSWKQITTRAVVAHRAHKLLSNVQRAEVESKSQLNSG